MKKYSKSPYYDVQNTYSIPAQNKKKTYFDQIQDILSTPRPTFRKNGFSKISQKPLEICDIEKSYKSNLQTI